MTKFPLVSRKNKRVAGQSVVEMALALPFLLVIVILLVEMGIAFGSYISLVNATREGAIFASMHPELSSSANDNNTYGNSTLWNEYVSRVSNEVFVVVGEPLKASGMIDQDLLTVDRPVLCSGSACPTTTSNGIDCVTSNMGPNCPITVTAHYRMHTLTSDMSFPVFGRLGLPNYYQLNYTMGMGIRGQ